MIGAMRRLLFGPLLAAAAALAAPAATADPHPSAPLPSAEPPQGRVGRLAAVSGKVVWRAAGAASWSDSLVNLPVAEGAAVRTDRNSQGTIEIGADSIALSENTLVQIAGLDGRATDLALMNGQIGLTLNRRGAADVEIDLPQGGVWLAEPGAYRIDADGPSGPAQIVVFAGGARLYAAGAQIGIGAGKAVLLSGSTPFAATFAPAVGDAFAGWLRARSGDVRVLAAPYFVSPDITGFGALAAAGHWQRTAEYGEVWRPDAVSDDWVPYRNGRWRWIPPWGWTWIDDQPWGFAPFHYGRWALLDHGWVWVPGSLAEDPVYLPAAVAFLGTPGIGISYAAGDGPAIGWFPLAPGEAYWPSYSNDLDYIRAANRGVVSNLDGIAPEPDGRLPVEVVGQPFANRLAASVVPRSVFVGGQPVTAALLELPKQRLEDVPVVLGSPRIGPPTTRPTPPLIAAVRALPARSSALTEAKRAVWVKTVHLAAIRSRAFVHEAKLRYLVALRPAHHHTGRN
jgi:hypothetical protein